MILANHGIISSSGALSFDADAQAFITAASITDNTQKTAVNTLVTDLKTANIWTKMKAIYPFVGGTATSHKFNLKDPRDLDAAYRLVFNGGWTHSSTGALPNGTTAYADTKLIPSSVLSQNSTHISSYIRNTTTGILMGTDNSYRLWIAPNFNGSQRYVEINTTTPTPSVAPVSSVGFWIGNRTASNSTKLFLNNTTNYTHTTASTGLDIRSIFLASRSDAGTAINLSSAEISLSSIGDGLSDTEASNFYTAVQNFNTTLNRQV